MSITLQEAQEFLKTWREAERAVATGQSYKIGSRELRRVDLNDIAKRISYWESEVERLQAGRQRGARVMRFVPRDY